MKALTTSIHSTNLSRCLTPILIKLLSDKDTLSEQYHTAFRLPESILTEDRDTMPETSNAKSRFKGVGRSSHWSHMYEPSAS